MTRPENSSWPGSSRPPTPIRQHQHSPPKARSVLLALTVSILALIAALATITVRTDMAAFLPATPGNPVLEELRTGAATGILLVGIEHADPQTLARIATAMAQTLEQTKLFTAVLGGPNTFDPALLFAHRYQLADPDLSTEALHRGMTALLRQMRSAAGPMAAQYGLADPPGAFPTLLKSLGDPPVRILEGAWFAPDLSRALLLLRTRAPGMDIPAQTTAIAAIDHAFAATNPSPARLLVSGPGVFARDAAAAIRADVERISILSTLLVIALLWWRFRSLLVLAAIGAPVILSVAIAALTVQALFGAVHGIALGFGATMLGVSLDYPVLMIGHRKRSEPAAATRARIGRAFIMAVACAVIGLLAMIASGFPGLVQLGTFAATGLLACAILTWTILPRLIVAADLAPVAAGEAWLPRIERLRHGRALAILPIAAAAVTLTLHGITWESDLQALSPVPPASIALDREIRAQLGAGDAGQLVLIGAPTADAVLAAQESLLPTLDRLREAGALRSYEAAARILPSAARQQARRAAIPPDIEARVAAAQAGLPFRPGAFDPFLRDIAAVRNAPPLRPDDLAGTPLAIRLEPLLQRRGEAWLGPIILQGVTDPASIAAAMPPGTYIDIRHDLGTILADTTARAWWWLAASLALALAVLFVGLRDARSLRVLASLAAAILVTVAILAALGTRLSLIHLVALQLVVGVGLDYALFFARRQLDAEERARTLRTLVTCCAMTLLTFGLLAACQTPLLRDIGITVAIGASLAMAFAFLIAGETPSPDKSLSMNP